MKYTVEVKWISEDHFLEQQAPYFNFLEPIQYILKPMLTV